MTQITFVIIPHKIKTMDKYKLYDIKAKINTGKLNIQYSVIQRAIIDDWHTVPKDQQLEIKQEFLDAGYAIESED